MATSMHSKPTILQTPEGRGFLINCDSNQMTFIRFINLLSGSLSNFIISQYS